MEEIVKKLEKLFGQKLEVEYGDRIVVKSSDSNPPEMRDFKLEYDNRDDAIKNLIFLINIVENEP